MGYSPDTTKAMPLCSAPRRRRNQEAAGIRCVTLTGMPDKSRSTRLKPPACTSKSAALSAASLFPSQRTQRKRENSSPAACAVSGSKVPRASTSAPHSPRCKVKRRREYNKLVRPEETAPEISVSAARGMPPLRSIASTPLKTGGSSCRGERKGSG